MSRCTERWALLITAATLGLRLILSLTHDGFLGVDGGAYLLQAKRLLDPDIPLLGFQRPPLGPGWMLVPFIELLGDDAGYKVWNAIASVAPIPTAYLLARRILTPKQTVVALIFVAANPWHWEMLVTGGLPLIGISLIFLCAWGIIGIIEGSPSRWEKLVVIGSIALIPYINQTSTGLAALALPALVLTYCASWRSVAPLRAVAPYWAVAFLLTLPSLYFYGDVLFNSDYVAFPGSKLYIYQGYHGGMLVATYGLYIAYNAIKHSSTPIKALGIVLAVHSFLPLFASHDEAIINVLYRSQHLATPLMMLLGTWYVAREVARVRIGRVAIGTALAAVVLFGASLWVFDRQTSYSDMVTPDMNTVRTHIPPAYDGWLITTNGSTGYWLGALQGIPSYHTFSSKPPPAGQEWYPSVRCVLGWVEECDPRQAARELGTQWILIDTRFPIDTHLEPPIYGAPEDGPWSTLDAAPWLTEVANSGTVGLWKVGGA